MSLWESNRVSGMEREREREQKVDNMAEELGSFVGNWYCMD